MPLCSPGRGDLHCKIIHWALLSYDPSGLTWIRHRGKKATQSGYGQQNWTLHSREPGDQLLATSDSQVSRLPNQEVTQSLETKTSHGWSCAQRQKSIIHFLFHNQIKREWENDSPCKMSKIQATKSLKWLSFSLYQ